MPKMILSFIVFLIYCFIYTGKATTECKSQNEATITKRLGSTFHFRCVSNLCGGKTFNYTHHDQLSGESMLVHQGPRYSQKISSLDDGGDYCCIDQCSNSKTISSTATSECCVTVTILPVILWDVPKVVAVDGDLVTGSCSASGYPRPNVRVVIPGCDYKQENVHVGKHTNKAVFTMNVTKSCGRIYCLITSKAYNVLRTKELLIVENVVCEDNREARSIQTTVKTSISKQEKSSFHTRNTKNDDKTVTYARTY